MASERQSKANDRRSPPALIGKYVALDVETDGLDPYHGARLFCWGYFTEDGEYGFMLKTSENLAWLKRLFADSSKTLIFHNAKFDLKMFWFEGIDIFAKNGATVDCTLILSKLFNMSLMSYKLEDLGDKLLGRDTADKTLITDHLKSIKRSFVKEHCRNPGFHDAPIDMVRKRCLWDVKTTLMLHRFLRDKVKKMCNELYQTERRLMYVVIDMENTGVRVDISHAEQLRDEAVRNVKVLRKKLIRLVCPFDVRSLECPDCGRKLKSPLLIEDDIKAINYCDKCCEYITPHLRVERFQDEFNPGSKAIQVPSAFEKMGFQLLFKTKPKKNRKKGGHKTGGGRWSFDEYAMVRYVSKPLAAIIRDSGEEGWPFDKWIKSIEEAMIKHKLPKRDWLPPLILKIGELEKMVSTYYENIITNAVDVTTNPKTGRKTGILHCKFNQSEALTGRFSSSQPNLQNQPRILGPRECYIPRSGCYNLHGDYEQVEMKLFVHYAEDEDMAQAIDKDIHLHVAAEIYDKPIDKVTSEQRKRAKGVNFGIIYGAGAATMAETLTKKGLPTTNSEAFQLVNAYHRRFPSVRRLTGRLSSELQKKGYVTNPHGRRYQIDKRFSYKALNYLCQGESADLMKAAMVKVWTKLRELHPECKMLMTVHDEMVVQSPKEIASQVMTIMRSCMEDKKRYYVPITVDFEINNKRWSEKVKVKNLGIKF